MWLFKKNDPFPDCEGSSLCSQFLVIIMCSPEWFYGLGVEDYANIKPFKFKA